MSSNSEERKWACEYCTYENFPASKKCTLCRAPRRPQFIDPDDTGLHTNDIYKMASPLVPSPSEPASSGGRQSPNESWACRMCTFINQPKAANCVQCLTMRAAPRLVGSDSPATNLDAPLTVDVNESIGCVTATTARKNSPSSPEAAKASNNDKNKAVIAATDRSSGSPVQKWSCKACTYDNWPRSLKCVICGVAKSRSTELLVPSSPPSEKVSTPLSERVAISYTTTTRETSESGAAAAGGAEHRVHDECAISRSALTTDGDRHRKSLRRRLRDIDWLFLTACQAVVDGDTHAVEAYVAAGGDARRQLTSEECLVLGRPSAFTVGYTLVHLAVRFQREDILALLLALADNATALRARKRTPSYAAPDVAAEIMGEISGSVRQRKGDFPCYFCLDVSTFALPAEIEEFPNAVKKQLFDELLDRNAQKELEDEEPVINWSTELTDRLGSRLYPLWNRTAGDCLLDSLLQVTWGVMDRDNTLRRALADSLNEGAHMFFPRFKFTEALQADLLNFSIEERQFERDWSYLLSLATKPGTALEQIHVFALAHILRRPIIIYGIRYIKSLSGDNIGYAKFQGVYLPLLWEQSFCWRTPVALGYTRGHFNALVPLEVDTYAGLGGARGNNDNSDDDVSTVYLPLIDYEGKLLPIHFLQASELGHEESLLHEWLECCITDGGILVAKQSLRKPTPRVNHMLDEWLHRYRRLSHVVQSAASVASGSHTPGHVATTTITQRRSPVGAESSEEESDDE